MISCNGGCDFLVVVLASIYILTVGEALAHYFIHHDAAGYRHVERVYIAKLGNLDESIA